VEEKKNNGADGYTSDTLLNSRRPSVSDKPPITPDKRDPISTNGTHSSAAASAVLSSPVVTTPKREPAESRGRDSESKKTTTTTPTRAASGSVKDKDAPKTNGNSAKARRKSAGNPTRMRELISPAEKAATATPTTLSSMNSNDPSDVNNTPSVKAKQRRRTEKYVG